MRKKIFRAIALVIIPIIGSLLIRLLYLTNKKEFHAPESISDDGIIFSCWHGELLMTPYAYRRLRKKTNFKMLISDHFDGNVIAKTMGYFGIDSIRGSSTRNGARALIKSIKDLKNGSDLGITPDGPKGPRHEVADGIIVMAQKANAKILLMEIKPSKYWQLSSWDKFIIPKPFGTIKYYISDAVDISDMDSKQAKEVIKKGLLKHEY